MRVMPDRLKEVAIHILKGLKVSDAEAELVAESLVRADMRGIDTHGVVFLRLLADRVDTQMVDLPTHLAVIKEDRTTAVIDGGNGLGQVATHRAMEMSIQRAREFGMGLTLLRNTNHIGFLAFYSLMAAEQNMVGVVLTNGAPSMSPWGGAEAMFGTNPISVAFPGGPTGAVVADMSSSVVARGKIRRAERLKEPIPLGWAFDSSGGPTTDPQAALDGTLAPIGGPKGYALTLMVDVLAGMLSGSKYGPDVRTFHQLLGPTGVGALTMAIDIERFMPPKQFKVLMTSYGLAIQRSKKAKGVSRIFLPGEIESEKEKQSLSEGIELDPGTVNELNQLLAKVKSPVKLNERGSDERRG